LAEEFNEEMRVNLDMIDEVREEARIKVKALKRRVEYKHKSKLLIPISWRTSCLPSGLTHFA